MFLFFRGAQLQRTPLLLYDYSVFTISHVSSPFQKQHFFGSLQAAEKQRGLHCWVDDVIEQFGH